MRKTAVLKSFQIFMKILPLSAFLFVMTPLLAENATCSNGEKPLKIELAWGEKYKCPDGSTPKEKRPKQQMERKEIVEQKSEKNSDIQKAKNHHERLLTMMLKSTFRAPQWKKYLTDSGIDYRGCKQSKPEKEFIRFLYDDELKSLNVGFNGTPPDYDNCVLSSRTFQLAKESYFGARNVPSGCYLHVDENQKTPYLHVKGGEGRVAEKQRTGCLLKIEKQKKKVVAKVNLIDLEVKTKKGTKRYDGFYKLEYDKDENSVKELELKYSEIE